jgi:hypothetical protein
MRITIIISTIMAEKTLEQYKKNYRWKILTKKFTSIRNHKGRRNNPLPHRHRMGIDVMLQTQRVAKIFKLKKSRNQSMIVLMNGNE